MCACRYTRGSNRDTESPNPRATAGGIISGKFSLPRSKRSGAGESHCRRLQLEFQQLPSLQAERLSDERQISQTHLNLSRLDLGQVAPVNPQALAHLKLCPALLLPEGADSPA